MGPAIRVAATTLVAISLALGVGCSDAPAADKPSGPVATASQPAATAASQPATQPAALALTLPAILRADETVDLYAKASGYISMIDVDIGSRVRRDDVLVVLSIPELGDQLRHAEAELGARKAKVEALKAKAAQAQLLVEFARAEHKRYVADYDLSKITFDRKKDLFEGKAIPAQEFDVANSQLEVSDAQVAMAQAKTAAAEGDAQAALADVKAAESQIAVAEADIAQIKTLIQYTTVKAPFDGVITRRGVDHGAFVRSAAQGATAWLLTVDKVDRLRVVVDVPEAEAPRVRPGTPVSIELNSLRGQLIKATVTRTAVAIRSDTRTMRTEIDLENKDGRLSPGMYAKVTLEMPNR
jgi:HlyD family secretion protein